MKKYNELLKEIEKTYKAQKAAEVKEQSILDSIYSAPDLLTRHKLRKETEADYIKANEKTQNLKFTYQFLRHNAKIALFSEIVPVIVEALEHFKNKPYGEKTSDAFSNYVKEKSGCRCYISNRYDNSEINIYPDKNGYDITIGTPAEKLLLIDNKIQTASAEDFNLWYMSDRYFDDIPGAIRELKKAYKKAVEKQKELDSICTHFNSFAVGAISRIYKDKYIYETLTI